MAGGFGVDRVYEIRPTEGEIVRACIKQDQHGVGLRFDAKGTITHWRATNAEGNPLLDNDGEEQWFAAREGYRQSKGSRRESQHDLAEENARHIALRGSGGFPERSSYVEHGSSGDDYARMRHATMCHLMVGLYNDRRIEIDRAGVGGRHSFDEAWANAGLFPACRIPRYVTGIARGVTFLAGTTRANKLATPGSFVGASDAVENALVTAIDAPKMEASLGVHAGVLNEALDGMTAREVATKRGWGESKSAEQRAVRAQDRALDALAATYRKAA
jgi:hypothetical protein